MTFMCNVSEGSLINEFENVSGNVWVTVTSCLLSDYSVCEIVAWLD